MHRHEPVRPPSPVQPVRTGCDELLARSGRRARAASNLHDFLRGLTGTTVSTSIALNLHDFLRGLMGP